MPLHMERVGEIFDFLLQLDGNVRAAGFSDRIHGGNHRTRSALGFRVDGNLLYWLSVTLRGLHGILDGRRGGLAFWFGLPTLHDDRILLQTGGAVAGCALVRGQKGNNREDTSRG